MAPKMPIILTIGLLFIAPLIAGEKNNGDCDPTTAPLSQLEGSVAKVQKTSQEAESALACGANRRLSEIKKGLFVQYRIHKKSDGKNNSKDKVIDVAEDHRWLNSFADKVTGEARIAFCDAHGCVYPGNILSPAQKPKKYHGEGAEEVVDDFEGFDFGEGGDPFGDSDKEIEEEKKKSSKQKEGHDKTNSFKTLPEDQWIDENAKVKDYEGHGEVVHIYEKDGNVFREVTIFDMFNVKMGITNINGTKMVTMKPKKAPLSQNEEGVFSRPEKRDVYPGKSGSHEKTNKMVETSAFSLPYDEFIKSETTNYRAGKKGGTLILKRYTEKVSKDKNGKCKIDIVKADSDYTYKK